MEDTPKLTQFYSQEEMELQLLDDFFRGRKFDGEQLLRWDAMRDGLFLSPAQAREMNQLREVRRAA
jgi:hypothetical protein